MGRCGGTFHRWGVLPVVGIWLALAAGNPVFGQMAPDESAKRLKPAEGLESTLWASEPMVRNPTNMDIDSRGRVWITEGLNYRLFHNKQFKRIEGADAIKILADTDGDGKADRVTVFADDIYPVPMGIAVVERYRDGKYAGCWVYVGNSPNLLVLEDTDGDDRADKRYNLLTGFGGVDSDHGVHGMALGPDGKLYFTHGDGLYGEPGQYEKKKNTSLIFDVTDRSGRHIRNDQRGATLRVNLDGTHLEILAIRFRNDYEVCVDSYGHVFVSDNDDDGNRGCRTLWIMEGGNYGYKIPGSNHHWAEDLPGIVPKLVGTGNGSPAGILIYEGALFGKQCQGAVLQVDAGTRQINLHPLTRFGAGFRTEYKVLMGGDDSWYRPIDAAVAPDGALYLIDWYDSGVGGNQFADQTTGRIYRLAPKGAAHKAVPVDFGTIPGPIRALASPVVTTRFAARQLLIERKREAIGAVRKLFKTGSPVMRARALHVLYGMEQLGRETVLAALGDSDGRIREQALRLMACPVSRVGLVEPASAGQAPSRAEAVLEHILPLADDSDAGVRRELLLAIRYVPTPKIADALCKLADGWDGQDRYYLEALVLALADREAELKKRILDQVTAWTLADVDLLYRDLALPPYFPTTTNDAFLRPGDRLPVGNPAAKLIGLAWALGWDGAASHLARLLDRCDSPMVLRGVEDAAVRFQPSVAGAFFARRFAKETDPARQRELLAMIGRKLRGKPDEAMADASVRAAIETGLEREDLEESAVRTIGQIKTDRYTGRLMKLVDEASKDTSIRAAAIEALGRLKHRGLSEKVAQLVEETKESNEVSDLSRAALQALADLAGEKAVDDLTNILLDEDYPNALRRAAMRSMSFRPKGGMRLLDLAKEKKIPEQLHGELIALTHNHPDRRVRVRAAAEVKLPKSAGGRSLPPIAELLSRRGDAARGENVFFRDGEAGTTCGSCHRVQGRGQWVGPDLSTIGTKFGKDGLLDAILNPSGAVAYSFQTTILRLEDGRIFDGLVTAESTDELVLKTAQGERIIISTDEIEARRTGATSIMPEDLAGGITPQELVNLLAYLETLRSPVATPTEYHLLGPISSQDAAAVYDPRRRPDLGAPVKTTDGRPIRWRLHKANQDGLLDLANTFGSGAGQVVFCYLPIDSPIEQKGSVVFESSLDLSAWFNGRLVSPGSASGSNEQASQIAITLAKGGNDLVIAVTGGHDSPSLITTIVSEVPIRFR